MGEGDGRKDMRHAGCVVGSEAGVWRQTGRRRVGGEEQDAARPTPSPQTATPYTYTSYTSKLDTFSPHAFTLLLPPIILPPPVLLFPILPPTILLPPYFHPTWSLQPAVSVASRWEVEAVWVKKAGE